MVLLLWLGCSSEPPPACRSYVPEGSEVDTCALDQCVACVEACGDDCYALETLEINPPAWRCDGDDVWEPPACEE